MYVCDVCRYMYKCILCVCVIWVYMCLVCGVYVHVYCMCVCSMYYPCPQASPRFCLASVEKNREKAWDQNYVTDRKWWTWLARNMDSVCTNCVHHFRSVT